MISDDVITKNHDKILTFVKPSKLYVSFKRFCQERSENIFFIEFEPMCQSYGIYAIVWLVLPCLLVMSKSLYFDLILRLILGKITKFLEEEFSSSEVISQKTSRGGGGGVPSSAFRVKSRWLSKVSTSDMKLILLQTAKLLTSAMI